MRWKNRAIGFGSRRIKHKFCWLPELGDDDYWYWLEWVTVEQIYEDFMDEIRWCTKKVWK